VVVFALGFVDVICGGGSRWLCLLWILWMLFVAVARGGCVCSGFCGFAVMDYGEGVGV
jgi:hypothetical protein